MSSSGNRRAGWLALTTIALLGVVIALITGLVALARRAMRALEA